MLASIFSGSENAHTSVPLRRNPLQGAKAYGYSSLFLRGTSQCMDNGMGAVRLVMEVQVVQFQPKKPAKAFAKETHLTSISRDTWQQPTEQSPLRVRVESCP
mgnify:CR=1 FL=1